MNKKKIGFLDRDGTIIRDTGYLKKPSEIELIPRAVDGLVSLASIGFSFIVISNQSGIGRGYFTEKDYYWVQEALISKLSNRGIKILASYHCPHHPNDKCECRKPAPELVKRAVADHGLAKKELWFFGDKDSDVICGRAAGCKTVRIDSNYDKLERADYEVGDIMEFYEVYLNEKIQQQSKNT